MTKDEVREKVRDIFQIMPRLEIREPSDNHMSSYKEDREPYFIAIHLPELFNSDYSFDRWINGSGISWDEAFRDLIANVETKSVTLNAKLVDMELTKRSIEAQLSILHNALNRG